MRPLALVLLALAFHFAAVALTAQPLDLNEPDAPPAATAELPADSPPPPGIDPQLLAPLQGDALTRARRSLDEILAAIPLPAYLPPELDGHDEPARAEISPAAQRAYVAGRIAWREGEIFGSDGAISHLDRALHLAPDEPGVLRLLGHIYTTTGNHVRGAQYLERAVAGDPRDIESLFLLGRFAMERGELDEAIVLLHRCLELARVAAAPESQAVRPVVHYHLGSLLMNRGYAAASVEQLQAFFATADDLAHFRLIMPELVFLRRQQAAIWQALGDLHHQLGQPSEALEAYREAGEQAAQAAEDGAAVGGLALLPRRVYTHLRLGDLAEAERSVFGEQVEPGDLESLDEPMVQYLAEQGMPADRLAARLEAVYRASGRPEQLLLAILRLLPAERELPLLREHVLARPSDVRMMGVLLSRYEAQLRDAGPADPLLADLTRLVADVMRELDDEQVDALFAHWRLRVIGPQRMRDAEHTAALAAAHPDVALFHLLHAQSLLRNRQPDEAFTVLERTLELDPSLVIARRHLATLLQARDEHERVLAMLEPLGDSSHPQVVMLRESALLALGRPDEALALYDAVDTTAGEWPHHFVLRKADLLVRLGRHADAEAELLEALNRDPRHEPLYEALFELYEPADGSPPKIEDWQRQWSRLVRRLLDTIPDSRLGVLQRAILFEARRDFAEAERLLVGLLSRDDRDAEVLQQLLAIYLRTDRREEAIRRMEQTVRRHPDDARVLSLAFEFYNQIGDRARQLAVTEQAMALGEPGAQQRHLLAALYLANNKPEKVAEVLAPLLEDLATLEDPVSVYVLLGEALLAQGRLAEAEQQFEAAAAQLPERAADLLYRRAALVQTAGEMERSLVLMEQLLQAHPDHVPTNNDLAYHWTLQHKNLERAEAMLQKVVALHPDTSAYLDSMGWVHYMLGEFDEAVRWLRRARAAGGGGHPVILDHLGDALYRTDRKDEAVRIWREAMQRTNPRSETRDPDMQGLSERMQAKVAAVRAEQPAPVAPVPGEQVQPAEVP